MAEEHEEGLWLPGARFEADVEADRRSASILDRKEAVRIKSLDAWSAKELRAAADAAARAMEGYGPREADTGRFKVDVSGSGSFADIRDKTVKERGIFMMLERANVEELRELTATLVEIMEAAG